MNRFKQWKQAMRNTPPERLLKINMQGFVLQSIGIIVVCILLITSPMWWLILVFVFSLWNNYSGLVQNYQQYKQIIELKKEFGVEEPEDKSPHRNKSRLVKEKYGKKAGWITAALSVTCTVGVMYLITGEFVKWGWWQVLAYPLFFLLYYLIYFKLLYGRAKND